MEAYLDNSATTKPCKPALDEMIKALSLNYGNPSSQHELGIRALNSLKEARTNIAKSLFSQSDELYFAPSGTIANNAAIFGAFGLNKRKQHNIVTTAIEHPSVLQPIKFLESKGANVIYLKPNRNGSICKTELQNSINKNTSLISIMAVNNETGAISPISLIKNIVKRSGSSAVIHCDAVQAFGKMHISPKDLGIDLLTISSHKINGPKGAAALYLRKGLSLPKHIFGGGQESGLFSGTEDLPAILGFSAAVNDIINIENNLKKIKELRDYTLEELKAIDNICINSPENALPYILNISVLGIPSEVLVNFLSSQGVYISAGSACKRGHKSDVLKAMGLSKERLDSAVRISLSRYTKKEELDYMISKIKLATQKFRY